MKKNFIIAVPIIVVIIIAAILFLIRFRNADFTVPTDGTNTPGAIVPNPPAPQAYVPKDGEIEPVLPLNQQADHVIDITSGGFSPNSLTITKGDSVIWTSRDRSARHQIISTGVKYPEAGPNGTKMDSTVLVLGESWRTTFDVAGTWYYADKLNSSFTGVIIVQ